MNNIRAVFNLHGLQAQVLPWAILPLAILLTVFSLGRINSHQQSTRNLAAEEHSRRILALSELIFVQRDKSALRSEVTPEQVPAEALNLDYALNITHPNGVGCAGSKPVRHEVA